MQHELTRKSKKVIASDKLSADLKTSVLCGHLLRTLQFDSFVLVDNFFIAG